MSALLRIAMFFETDKGIRLFRWSLYAAAVFVVLGITVSMLRPHYMLGISETPSLPETVFLIVKHELPKKGELLVFRAPKTVKYYPVGFRFTKIVRGVSGDRVSFEGRRVFVNGQYLGVAKERSQQGKPLDLGPSGIIPSGHYFVWTPHKDSYDSRYADIGWIKPDMVEGRAIALF